MISSRDLHSALAPARHEDPKSELACLTSQPMLAITCAEERDCGPAPRDRPHLRGDLGVHHGPRPTGRARAVQLRRGSRWPTCRALSAAAPCTSCLKAIAPDIRGTNRADQCCLYVLGPGAGQGGNERGLFTTFLSRTCWSRDVSSRPGLGMQTGHYGKAGIHHLLKPALMQNDFCSGGPPRVTTCLGFFSPQPRT